jgi:hypothetical protein
MKTLLVALVALIPTFALADDLKVTREEARKDGSVWMHTFNAHKSHVFVHRERTKAPDGRYMMAADKRADWELNDPKLIDKALAELDKLPTGNAADVKAKEWVEICVEAKAKRCSKHAAADKGTKEDVALEKVQWELMNHTSLDSL